MSNRVDIEAQLMLILVYIKLFVCKFAFVFMICSGVFLFVVFLFQMLYMIYVSCCKHVMLPRRIDKLGNWYVSLQCIAVHI